MHNNRNLNPSLQLLILVLALIACVFLALVVNVHYEIDIVYTHLFYIPIVMAGVWYHRWALLIAGGLGAVHISCDYVINNGLTSSSLLRTGMFLGIALVVGLLSEKRDLLYQKLQKINNAMLDMITEVTGDGKITYISPSSIKLLGYSPEEMLGTSIFDLVHQEDLTVVKRKFYEAIHSGISMCLDYRCRHKDGSYTWVESLANPIMDESQRFSGYIFVTGLYNRMHFEEEMKRLNSGKFDPLAIVVADIDGLKITNDTFGHDAGDRLIITAGNFLLSKFRNSDIVSRIGGDEFAVFLPSCFQSVWEEIVKRISNNDDPPILTEDGIPLMISIGYALRTDNQQSMEGLFREADAMMYRQKGANRERFQFLVKTLR